jgi:hypothetical protein
VLEVNKSQWGVLGIDRKVQEVQEVGGSKGSDRNRQEGRGSPGRRGREP